VSQRLQVGNLKTPCRTLAKSWSLPRRCGRGLDLEQRSVQLIALQTGPRGADFRLRALGVRRRLCPRASVELSPASGSWTFPSIWRGADRGTEVTRSMPISSPKPARLWPMNRLGSAPETSSNCVPGRSSGCTIGHSERVDSALVATGKMFRRDRLRHRQPPPFRASTRAPTAAELAWPGPVVAAVGGLGLVGARGVGQLAG
jgi:hypothetical protein